MIVNNLTLTVGVLEGHPCMPHLAARRGYWHEAWRWCMENYATASWAWQGRIGSDLMHFTAYLKF